MRRSGYDSTMAISIEQILAGSHTGRSVVMGVLNVTPDSFSDGGDFVSRSDAAARIGQLAAAGADIIDVGPESTKPGSLPVEADRQIARIDGIIELAARSGAIVSIDTTSAEVAEYALGCGATIINDVSAGRSDPDIFHLAARRKAPMILMHMLGQPKTMQENPQYDDVVKQVRDFLSERIDAATTAGVSRKNIIVDPGIGFGKLLEHNLALLRGIPTLVELGCPVLVGASRKRFIGQLTGEESPRSRLGGSIAAVLTARARGATIFRVHDVAHTAQALKVAEAIDNCE